jgi:hypothetical protein
MANDVCKGEIGEEYGKRAIERISKDFAGKKEDAFDILVSVIPNYDKINELTGTGTLVKKKLECITGFIIVEKGECKKLPDVYSVNLICTRGRGKVVKIVKGENIYEFNTKSVILLGAFLYCIKNSPHIRDNDKRGILELAGAYNNMTGFFAYSKVGFDKDESLFDMKKNVCFHEATNLPMSVDLTDYTSENIIDMVSGYMKRNNVKDDTGIIEMGLPNTEEKKIVQRNLGILYNMKEYLALTKRDPYVDKKIKKLIDYKKDVMTKSNVNDKIAVLDEFINKEKRKVDILLKTNDLAQKIANEFQRTYNQTNRIHSNKTNSNKRSRSYSSKSKSPSPSTKKNCENNRKTRRNSRSPSPIGCTIAGGK